MRCRQREIQVNHLLELNILEAIILPIEEKDMESAIKAMVQPLQEEDFVLMLVHTPDYVEDVNVAHTDLALAGHTHGGQVSLFRRWTPAHFSKYGNRFLTGLKYNSAGIPVIITNGLGTSRKDVRLFTPSEVVLVVLHKKK